MLTEEKISWGNAHYLWNDFKLGDAYIQYLKDEYGIILTGFDLGYDSGFGAPPGVIWNHVFNVVEVTVVVPTGGAGEDAIPAGKKKPKQKRIKLIFIMGDIHKELDKEVKSLIAPKIISDIKNKIEEQVKAKITLTDVQIIKG